MATTAVTRKKRTDPKLKDFARELSNDIGLKARLLPEPDRKRRHAKLLEIANRGPK